MESLPSPSRGWSFFVHDFATDNQDRPAARRTPNPPAGRPRYDTAGTSLPVPITLFHLHFLVLLPNSFAFIPLLLPAFANNQLILTPMRACGTQPRSGGSCGARVCRQTTRSRPGTYPAGVAKAFDETMSWRQVFGIRQEAQAASLSRKKCGACCGWSPGHSRAPGAV